MSVYARVSITGTGLVSALGNSVNQGVQQMLLGEGSPVSSERVKSSHRIIYPVMEVRNCPGLAEAEETGLLRTNQLALMAVEEALQQAGLNEEDLRNKKVGVCIGSTVGCAMNNEPFYDGFRKEQETDMAPIHRFLDNNPARVIARKYKLSGPCVTVNNACSSGTDAIGLGASWLNAGLCDVVIAGGADELCRVVYNGFIALQVASSEPCRPFDKDRGGLNLGEGAGILVMESSPQAKPVGYFLGYGNACDAHHMTAPSPDGDGLRRALEDALKRSSVSPEEIAFINAHGTGTRDNDRVEGNVFADMFPGIPYLSTKGYTGHTLGAAGGIEAVLTLAFLKEQKIPASHRFEQADEEILSQPVDRVTPISGRIALSDSLAFGGNNSAIILEVADE